MADIKQDPFFQEFFAKHPGTPQPSALDMLFSVAKNPAQAVDNLFSPNPVDLTAPQSPTETDIKESITAPEVAVQEMSLEPSAADRGIGYYASVDDMISAGEAAAGRQAGSPEENYGFAVPADEPGGLFSNAFGRVADSVGKYVDDVRDTYAMSPAAGVMTALAPAAVAMIPGAGTLGMLARAGDPMGPSQVTATMTDDAGFSMFSPNTEIEFGPNGMTRAGNPNFPGASAYGRGPMWDGEEWAKGATVSWTHDGQRYSTPTTNYSYSTYDKDTESTTWDADAKADPSNWATYNWGPAGPGFGLAQGPSSPTTTVGPAPEMLANGFAPSGGGGWGHGSAGWDPTGSYYSVGPGGSVSAPMAYVDEHGNIAFPKGEEPIGAPKAPGGHGSPGGVDDPMSEAWSAVDEATENDDWGVPW